MLSALSRVALAAMMTAALAACSTGGLSPGLSQRMDMPGAQLNRADALNIVNQYRSSTGAGPLTDDSSLDATAQTLVTQYAKTGHQPAAPAGTLDIRYSAGYFTFAETFSGWRNSTTDAPAIADAKATRAGLAAIFDNNTPYGVYWVIILG
ncbi:MAG TPA: CAP domain-containing protein [Devosia sp.]|jgi:uncharacterized protein YkwD|nr:CAP domain-containing protein [Devosia sp.]